MKKIIVLFFALTLLLGTVTVYANSSAGERLTNWYKGAYSKSTDATIPVVVDGLIEIQETAKRQSKILKKEAATKIESFYLTTSSDTKGDIENYQVNYKTRLIETQSSLEETSLSEFAENKKADLEIEITEDVELMLSEVLGE